MRPPETFHVDFDTLSQKFPDQTIYMLEIGYPSGTENGSSEARQAEFIREMFNAWDDHAGQIPVINYTWLTDVPAEAVDGMTDYNGLDAPGLVGFLSSLGLRTSDGRNKLALTQFQTEIDRHQKSSTYRPVHFFKIGPRSEN